MNISEDLLYEIERKLDTDKIGDMVNEAIFSCVSKEDKILLLKENPLLLLSITGFLKDHIDSGILKSRINLRRKIMKEFDR